MRALAIFLIIISVAFFAYRYLWEFNAVDSCVDSGGAYSYETATCITEGPSPSYVPFARRFLWEILVSGIVLITGIVLFLVSRKPPVFKQKFWNRFLNKKSPDYEKNYAQFIDWVKDENAESKVYLYDYLETKKYKNIVDLGCGAASIFDGLSQRNIPIEYTGVDSCDALVEETNKRCKVIHADVRKLPFADSAFEIAMCRHVVEHQSEFKRLFDEMIRVAEKEMLCIFFIKPGEKHKTYFDKPSGLYHNTYRAEDIISFLTKHPKVERYNFVDINQAESALHVQLKA